MRRVLVTGANRGLGLEFVRQLLARGNRVIAAARQPGRATDLTREAAAHPGRLHVLPCDMAQPRSIEELARETAMLVDGLDVLINNAGVLPRGERFGSVQADSLERAFRTNAMGPYLLTQALAPLLAKGEAPRVLNLSTSLGALALVESARTPSYAISKAALNMATLKLAQALREDGVAVVAANPGWVRTEMGGESAELAPEEAVADLLALLDRIGPGDSGRFLDGQGDPLPW